MINFRCGFGEDASGKPFKRRSRNTFGERRGHASFTLHQWHQGGRNDVSTLLAKKGSVFLFLIVFCLDHIILYTSIYKHLISYFSIHRHASAYNPWSGDEACNFRANLQQAARSLAEATDRAS